ncbi:FlgD immunoglobulin-like domain containing protein [Deinococcus sp. JMULE3]|uniref:FlgD immunoglobulin-like domain containing protein n=1 Tax=Deinococcus sp. JMULE3 TaxID=2518341 RepID=UPI001576970A|nr:FlgD immunoglobulin-like domain containing protein [Deinococcus sp. JMULE3]
MTLRFLLTAAVLTSSLAQAQTTIFNIPALPPRSSAPATPAPASPAPMASSLPMTLPMLGLAHSANLSGPGSLRAGEATTWTFTLSNLDEQTIDLQHGACDVRFEVLDAAGKVVRANPTNTVCTMQLVMTDVAPGETMDVQDIRWDGRNSAGRALPAGEYTIRAVFSGAGVRIMAEEFPVTIEN